ncbi:DUF1707 domain-containing protein [Nocardia sp. NPDC049220]|uniref:DUF1707 domain-containing protein n=1 Tax=Nocardia sp. NPDC049220 TaxID=3155273 RepID=UPI0033DAA239
MTNARDDASKALPAIRIGDADREIAARQLQLVVEGGRLDLMELDRRLVAVGSPLLRIDGEVGTGVITARYPHPPRRSFLAFLLRHPRPVA